MFNTPYHRIYINKPEQNSGELKTERAGYIPAQKRIENLMLAGQRLVSSRKEMYDFPDGKIDEFYDDPTRKKNFDLAEAFQAGLVADHNLKASQDALKASRDAKHLVNKVIDQEDQKDSKKPLE